MWVWEKMVPKRKLPEIIPLHDQRLNCGTNVYELEDHVREKGLNLNWLIKLGLAKKKIFKFSLSYVKKHLNRICISLCLVALP
jgi:hypothetical protein